MQRVFFIQMGAAGGLTNLSKMPANNVSLLGQTKKVLSGFSSTTALPHTGFVYYSDIVQRMPPVRNITVRVSFDFSYAQFSD